MLDTQTKQRINNARQVLVGVVPHPQAQIEQITTALIYKFMDDMDRENEEIGRQATFLCGELAPFAWGKLMSRALSGDARWQLYVTALENFAKAKQIPSFFRTIFKDAYLPYRDSRVLNLFLTEINGFSYEHSEKLGDAFEYLLSISGAQADAGQFRTPRHIIDFIIEIIAPQKFERILDPACGTAGFLISAYKHIIKHNSSRFNPDKANLPFAQQGENASDLAIQNNGYDGDKLTSDERATLANNIHGYDVAPEMVRLSLVNLYLHGFISPQISNYDTLTYDTNWNDDYDVILANPPFMTPKGGIRPHNRFSVRANRAEVLFVDYIAEHLTIKGRAGIIVPEGIIFQAANAYKSLRKNLIENWGLYCVVSLPAGIFQPYAGVKTSILLLDKTQTKKPNILFINIQNDGFDLGAKRQKIAKNDLPLALDAIKHYHKTQAIKECDNDLALIVEKSKIAEDGDYNLTANRYKEVVDYSNAKWDMVALGDLEKQEKIQFLRGQGISKKDIVDNGKNKCIHYGELYTLYKPVIEEVTSRTNFMGKVLSVAGDVLIPSTTTADAMGLAIARAVNEDGVVLGADINIVRTENKIINSNFLSWLLNYPLKKELASYAKGVNILHISNKDIKQIKIPLPPLKIQQQIIAEIEAYQKVIDGAKQVIKHYKPTLKINPDWAMVALGDVCEIKNGLWEGKKEPFEIVKIIRNTNFSKNGGLDLSDVAEHHVEIKQLENKKLKNGDIVLENSGGGPTQPVGRVVYFETNDNHVYSWSNFTSRIRVLDDRVISKYLFFVLNHFYQEGNTENFQKRTSGIRNLDKKLYQQIKIPLPSLKIQQQIVAEIESEQKAIAECKKLSTSQEQKIKTKMDEVWG